MKTSTYVTNETERSLRTTTIENAELAEAKARERAKKNHDFVQFQRKGMAEFAALIARSPSAAQALLTLAIYMSRTNLVAASMKTMQTICGTSRATMSRAINLLSNEGWINLTRIETTRAYQINATVFWSAQRSLKTFGEVFKTPLPNRTTTAFDIEIVIRSQHLPIITLTPKSNSSDPKQEQKRD